MRLRNIIWALALVVLPAASVAESIEVLDCDGNLKGAHALEDEAPGTMLLQFEGAAGPFSVKLLSSEGHELVKESNSSELAIANPAPGKWTVCAQPSARLAAVQFKASSDSEPMWKAGGALAGAGILAAAFAMNDSGSSGDKGDATSLRGRRPPFVSGRKPTSRNPDPTDCLNPQSVPELSPFE